MELRIRILNQEAVIRSLVRVKKVLSHETLGPQKVVSEEIMKAIRNSFASQQSQDGIPWKPRSGGGPALVRTRSYMNSFFPIISQSQVQVNTIKPELLSHDKGSEIRSSKGLIAIPFFGIFRPMPGESWRSAFPNAFVIRAGADRLFLVQRISGSGKGARDSQRLAFIAMLLPSVKMPLRPHIPRFLPPNIMSRLIEMTNREWS